MSTLDTPQSSTTRPQDDSAHWAEWGKTFGIGFAAGLAYANILASQHQAVQEAQAERRLGAPRQSVQVVIGVCMDVDEDTFEMQVNTELGRPMWAFFGNTISVSDAKKMAERRQRVRITIPTGAQGSHRAFYSGEMVNPSDGT